MTNLPSKETIKTARHLVSKQLQGYMPGFNPIFDAALAAHDLTARVAELEAQIASYQVWIDANAARKENEK
jgi:hypothetical protein